MAVNPTHKLKDSDFGPMLLISRRAGCACPCPCCAAGRCGGHAAGGAASPLGERPLGCEPDGIAADALERRLKAITEVLLPQARTLSASMARANEQGTIGFGELETLGTLQWWVLQLQIEQDDLRRCLTPPDLAPKAP